MTNHNIDHIVGQLVGPAAPEASCEECFDQLDVYVDREDVRTGNGVETALSGSESIRVVAAIAGG